MGLELVTSWTPRVKKSWYDRHPERSEEQRNLERSQEERPRVTCSVHLKYHTARESYAKHVNQRRQEEYGRAFAALLTQEDRAVLRRARVIAADPTLEQQFIQQADKWQWETAHLSSPLQRMMHPSYQAVLGMGAEHKRDIVRLMLRDMQKTRRDWLLALSYLTQANPINPKDAGKTDEMIEAWINWGREHGLLQT
jgi:hypothetical protein